MVLALSVDLVFEGGLDAMEVSVFRVHVSSLNFYVLVLHWGLVFDASICFMCRNPSFITNLQG